MMIYKQLIIFFSLLISIVLIFEIRKICSNKIVREVGRSRYHILNNLLYMFALIIMSLAITLKAINMFRFYPSMPSLDSYGYSLNAQTIMFRGHFTTAFIDKYYWPLPVIPVILSIASLVSSMNIGHSYILFSCLILLFYIIIISSLVIRVLSRSYNTSGHYLISPIALFVISFVMLCNIYLYGYCEYLIPNALAPALLTMIIFLLMYTSNESANYSIFNSRDLIVFILLCFILFATHISSYVSMLALSFVIYYLFVRKAKAIDSRKKTNNSMTYHKVLKPIGTIILIVWVIASLYFVYHEIYISLRVINGLGSAFRESFENPSLFAAPEPSRKYIWLNAFSASLLFGPTLSLIMLLIINFIKSNLYGKRRYTSYRYSSYKIIYVLQPFLLMVMLLFSVWVPLQGLQHTFFYGRYILLHAVTIVTIITGAVLSFLLLNYIRRRNIIRVFIVFVVIILAIVGSLTDPFALKTSFHSFYVCDSKFPYHMALFLVNIFPGLNNYNEIYVESKYGAYIHYILTLHVLSNNERFRNYSHIKFRYLGYAYYNNFRSLNYRHVPEYIILKKIISSLSRDKSILINIKLPIMKSPYNIGFYQNLNREIKKLRYYNLIYSSAQMLIIT